MEESLDVLVAHSDPGRREHLQEVLEGMEHKVVSSVATGRALIKECLRLNPDLIVSNVDLDDMDGIDALIEASRHEPRPSVIVASDDDMEKVEKALEDHVMAYLVEPVDQDTLRPTIYLVRQRFEQFQELRQEIRDLKSALSARKSVERAKGLLMRERNLDEDAAYRLLRKTANDRRKTMAEVAEALLLARELSA